MKTFFAWHFTADKLRDGSPLSKVGMWEHYEGKLELYKSGLHWSRDPFDALQHAPGANLRRVEIKGDILEQSNKGCSHYRRTVYQFDATELLRYFARMQALSIIHLYPNGADDVVFDYLMTGDESLRAAARVAARAAARASAGAAVRAAAEDAAWAAARDAVRDAAWAGARAAARVAARAAARAAAQAAVRDAARAAAGAAAGDAAGDAAWAGARAAAWAGARKDFNKLIEDTE